MKKKSYILFGERQWYSHNISMYHLFYIIYMVTLWFNAKQCAYRIIQFFFIISLIIVTFLSSCFANFECFSWFIALLQKHSTYYMQQIYIIRKSHVFCHGSCMDPWYEATSNNVTIVNLPYSVFWVFSTAERKQLVLMPGCLWKKIIILHINAHGWYKMYKAVFIPMFFKSETTFVLHFNNMDMFLKITYIFSGSPEGQNVKNDFPGPKT